ncbi:MAG: SpoVK/Ycf46/Vps4 family AAA+-type ATPase [Bacillariaceae sp.]|jgi:SpoVK/Ycf46/Vps4 family AAA+-type ATPase
MDSMEELVINASSTDDSNGNNDGNNDDEVSHNSSDRSITTGFSWPFSNMMNNNNGNDNNGKATTNSKPSSPEKDSKNRMSFGNSKNRKNNTTANPNIVPIIDDKFTVDRFQHDVEQAKLMRKNMDKRKQQQHENINIINNSNNNNDSKLITESDVRLGLDGLDQASILLRNGRTREAFKISELSIELLIDYLKSDPTQTTIDIPGGILSREKVGIRVQNALTAAEEMKLMLKNDDKKNTNNNNIRSSNNNIAESSLLKTLSAAIQRGKKGNKTNTSNNITNSKNAISSSRKNQPTSTTKKINTTPVTRVPKAAKTKNSISNNNRSDNNRNAATAAANTAPLINSQDPLVQTIKSELYIDQSQLQSTTWMDIAGLNDAKQALQEAAILPLMRPDLFSGLRRPRNIILYGPPGTGKTMLVKAVAHESSCVLFVCTASALTSKWHGEGEKLLKTLFQVARAAAPSIIFVDEMDALLSSRKSEGEHEASRRFKTEFMTNLDGIVKNGGGGGEEENGKNLLVIAATNCPWDIDSAVLRRFPRRIYVPLPESTTRKALLKKLLEKAGESDLTKEDIKVIVKRLNGFSGSDIASIASEASFGPIRSLGGIDAIQACKSSDIRPIQRQDFDVAIDQATKSVSKSLLKQYDEWKQDQAASS